jgi:hypothetical protein
VTAGGHDTDLVAKTTWRTHFSVTHHNAALHHAHEALAREEADTGPPRPDELLEEHRGYVTSSIISSFSFVEALVNEFVRGAAKRLKIDKQHVLVQLWPRIDRESTLEKAQIILAELEFPKFDKGCTPYQDVDLVRELRNELVHYRPKWGLMALVESEVEPGSGESAKLERKLGHRFDLNPLAEEGTYFFPDQCLGAGCAFWALGACRRFAEAFYEKLELEPPYTAQSEG